MFCSGDKKCKIILKLMLACAFRIRRKASPLVYKRTGKAKNLVNGHWTPLKEYYKIFYLFLFFLCLSRANLLFLSSTLSASIVFENDIKTGQNSLVAGVALGISGQYMVSTYNQVYYRYTLGCSPIPTLLYGAKK